jgi:hypothetical protein
MSRRKNTSTENAPAGQDASAVAVVEPQTERDPKAEAAAALPPMQLPAWIDGPPPQSAQGDTPGAEQDEQQKSWSDPYKPIFSGKGFELGEHRRFKQRVFRFDEKPAAELLAKLKEAGFTYRAAEKAWTIPANPDTRKLTDEMAREMAGPAAGMSR